jgi:hypothetical protein
VCYRSSVQTLCPKFIATLWISDWPDLKWISEDLTQLPDVRGVALDAGDAFLLVPFLKKCTTTIRLLEGNRCPFVMVYPAIESLMIDLTADAGMFEDSKWQDPYHVYIRKIDSAIRMNVYGRSENHLPTDVITVDD